MTKRPKMFTEHASASVRHSRPLNRDGGHQTVSVPRPVV
jgi:hypothetical protein